MQLFYYDFLLEEEVGINIYTDMQTDIEGEISVKEIPERFTNEKSKRKIFSGFLDGTMKLYRVGYAIKTGTPLYISPVSVALMIRDGDGRLHKSSYSVSFTLVLFPFETYREFVYRNFGEDLCDSWFDFVSNLQRKLLASGVNLIKGQELEGEEKITIRRKVFSSTDFWILSDTSRTGIYTKGRPVIQEDELFNIGKVKEVARARARYFMGLAEFYSGFRYLRDNSEAYLMIDGAFYPYKRVGSFFGIGKEEYRTIMGRAVGFIKHPQKVPLNKLIEFLKKWTSNKVLFWKGFYSEKESDLEESDRDREIFDFVLINFRGFGTIPSPTNLVKLQFSELSIEDVVNMIWYERNPLPTDRKRLYTEAYPIQIAESVAKASTPSEDMIRGFVLSLVPPVSI